MKTKRSMKERSCSECATTINKGHQYAQRSKQMGQTGMASYDGTVHQWEPHYVKVDICSICAGGE